MALLRDIVQDSTITPLHNNIYTVLLTVVYVKIGFETAAWIRWKMGKRHMPRIFVHLCLSSTIIFWPMYDTNSWSWRLNALVPAAVAARLVYKAMLVQDSEDEDVQIITRSCSPSELMCGPIQLNFLLIYLGINNFMSVEASIIVAAVGLGDSIAPWIGSTYGRHVYRMPFSRSKTVEGSFCGVFLGTVIGTYLNMWFLGLSLLPLRILLAHATVAAVSEGTAPSNLDNILVPIMLCFSMERIVNWFPVE